MSPPLKVLVTDHPWKSVTVEQEALSSAGAELVISPSDDEDVLIKLAGDADAILTCFARVTKHVVRSAPRLQVIGRYGVGVDNIAVDEATSRGILVTNTPSYCVDEVAEHALALILALGRQVLTFDRAVHSDNWALSTGQPIHRLRGSTLGIVGFGEIGRALARRAAALNMHVVAYHPRQDADAIRASGAEPRSLRALAETSDFVSLHTPLSDETRYLIDTEFLKSMKPSAYLVNTARGSVIDQDALAQALYEHWIAGAAVDVVEPQRLEAGHRLLQAPNLIITPHVAYYSEESLLDLGRLAAENVAAILTGRLPRSIVNPDLLSLERWAHLEASG